MTQPEHHLWRLLRDRWLAVLKFRRQQPVGDYIVDFFCEARTWSSSLTATAMTIAARMIVDGNNGSSRAGLRIMRISNDDVLDDPEAVVIGIAPTRAST